MREHGAYDGGHAEMGILEEEELRLNVIQLHKEVIENYRLRINCIKLTNQTMNKLKRCLVYKYTAIAEHAFIERNEMNYFHNNTNARKYKA